MADPSSYSVPRTAVDIVRDRLEQGPPAGLRLVAAGGDDLLFAVGDGAPP